MEFTCTKCHEKFKPGEWECFPGEPHTVAQKTYYIGNSLKDIDDRVKSRVTMFVTCDRVWTDAGGTKHSTPGRAVQFVGGAYSTDNPEDQFVLETQKQKSLITADQWKEQYIHPSELLAMKERELKARMERIEKQGNDLLAREKALKEREAELAASESPKGKGKG